MSNLEPKESGAGLLARPAKTKPSIEGRCIRILRKMGVMLGNRFCAPGDVIVIVSNDLRKGTLMPIDDQLLPGKARDLVSRGRCSSCNYHMTRPSGTKGASDNKCPGCKAEGTFEALAEYCDGPPTARVTGPTRDEMIASLGMEFAVKAPAQPERAIGKRQKAGAF